jgi:hypothetical protein
MFSADGLVKTLDVRPGQGRGFARPQGGLNMVIDIALKQSRSSGLPLSANVILHKRGKEVTDSFRLVGTRTLRGRIITQPYSCEHA